MSTLHVRGPARNGARRSARRFVGGTSSSRPGLLGAGWVLGSLLATACAHTRGSPVERLEAATARVQRGEASARDTAIAGFYALFVAGNAERASKLFAEASALDAAEPYALHGLTLLELRVAHPERALSSALDLCERAPGHLLTLAAAQTVLDLSGTALSLDESIRRRVPQVLAQNVRGEAAHLLRSALAVATLEVDAAAHRQVLADMGTPTIWTLVGPFSPWHRLSMADPTPVEGNGRLDGLGVGPWGPLVARVLSVADGRLVFSGEPMTGDVYVAAVDVDVSERALYVLRTVTSMDHVVVIDGAPIINRSTWRRPSPTVSESAVRLTRGKHRILVRMAREARAGHLTMTISRFDGRPSKLTFGAAAGPPLRWGGPPMDEATSAVAPSAPALYEALRPEAGDTLARLLAVRVALGRDADGARRVLAEVPRGFNAPAVASLRAEAALQDRSVPTRVAQGRATRELESVLSRDPTDVRARLATAQLVLDDGRALEALEHIRQARAAVTPAGGPVLALAARVELQLGLEAGAALSAARADEALPGECDALGLRYDLARRRDAVSQADALVEESAGCPGGLARRAEHQRLRGRIDDAIESWRRLRARDESEVSVATPLATLLMARRRGAEAEGLLAHLQALWPRSGKAWLGLADVFEHEGRLDEAQKAREEALRLDGGDLALRRRVERAKNGKEILEDRAISTEAALKAHADAPGAEDATSAYLLDAAAIRVFPDGSQVERIHVIQKALDQAGVADVAEVNVPADAAVLKLRTLKTDGTVLEAESFEGKESRSLPGVQVGDAVELEYLQARPSRGPGQPGFTASAFFFQVARQPNNWSKYTLLAPKGTGVAADAHGLVVPPPKLEGDEEVFQHEERRVPPYVPEPASPPSANEWLPFVVLGSGQRGNEALVVAQADLLLDHGLVTFEVDAFAREAAAGQAGVGAVRAVYAAVSERLSGRDSGLSGTAAATLAQERGSRTWLLLSALTALGFDARLAAVRTFNVDPALYQFPNESLLPYVCVRVLLPDGSALWLDSSTRYAPFGELPEWAMGRREAFVLPVPGRPVEKALTPERGPQAGKQVALQLELSEEGVLSGAGTERYSGYDAAQLAEALAKMTVDQRNQALQGAMSRYFNGADIADIEVHAPRSVGATVEIKYRFTAARFGRVEGERRLVLGALAFPAQLGRSLLAMSARKTPLYIDSSQSSHTVATLRLPTGWVLAEPIRGLRLEDPHGSLARDEAQVGNVLRVEETLRLVQSRVPIAEYDALAQFVGQVDLVQGRDLVLERR